MGAADVVGTVSITMGSGALTKSWPAAHRVDDVCLMPVVTQGGEAASLSTPSGFVQVGSPQSIGTGAGSTRLTLFACRATSTSMTDVTIADSGDHTGACMVNLRGVPRTLDLTTLAVFGGTAASSTSVSIPGGTTTTDDALIVLLAAHGLDVTSAQFSGEANADLVDLAEVLDGSSNVGTGGGILVAAGVRHLAGAYGATTTTLASASQQALMSVVIPSYVPADLDEEPPEIVDFGPIPVGPNDPITWTVRDDVELRSIVVMASFPGSGIDAEVVYDSERFRGLYRNAHGTVSGTTERVFTAWRSGGWPEPPKLEWVVSDASGNLGILG